MENLSDEHIIPYALNGHHVISKASCSNCTDITKKFEQTVARTIYGNFRIRHGIRTRHKKERPSELAIEYVSDDGSVERTMVPAESFPRMCLGLVLPLPGMILDKPIDWNPKAQLIFRHKPEDLKSLLKPNKTLIVGGFNNLAFMRQLAKIAHCFAVAKRGIDSFRPMLLDLILGRTNYSAYLIGGSNIQERKPQKYFHNLRAGKLIKRRAGHITTYVMVEMHLFGFVGMPRYRAIVGEDLTYTGNISDYTRNTQNVEIFVPGSQVGYSP